MKEDRTKFPHPTSPQNAKVKKLPELSDRAEMARTGRNKKGALRRCDGTAASGELDESHEPPRPGIVHEESLAESRASATNAG